MVKYCIIILLIFLSTVCSLSQTLDKSIIQNDTIDCLDEFGSLYGRNTENKLITYWSEAPMIKKDSKSYLKLICEQISMSKYEYQDLFILLLINEDGIPYCCSILKDGKLMKDEYKKQILGLCKLLKFTPAKSSTTKMKSAYTLVAKKNIKNNQWYFREYILWD